MVVPKSKNMLLLPENVRFRVYPKIIHPAFNLFFVSFESWKNNSDTTIFQNFAGFSRNGKVFIHDFIFFDHPEWFSKIQNRYFRIMKPMAKISGVKIFTSTETEKKRISKFLPSKHISIAPLGVSKALRLAEPERPKKLNIQAQEFYFTVGRNDPRKNLKLLISAYIDKSKKEKLPELIVLGMTAEEFSKSNKFQLESSSIHFLSHVSHSELSWLYKNCRTFFFLSLDEGFGLPVLEALYFKAPLVISDLEVFREVSCNSAIFINPQSAKDVSKYLSWNIDINHLGIQQANLDTKIFEWDQCVNNLREKV